MLIIANDYTFANVTEGVRQMPYGMGHGCLCEPGISNYQPSPYPGRGRFEIDLTGTAMTIPDTVHILQRY